MKTRKDKHPASGQAVRGKYAEAFKKGVKVIVHAPEGKVSAAGDHVRKLKRNAAGELVWTEVARKKASRAAS
jgi:hypothetical protein